jgi:ParB family chromosome partitioning protein
MIREENDTLAHEYVARRDPGGVVEQIGLDDVHTYMLVRHRFPGDDLELESLVTSIRESGLSNPIRVLTRPDGAGVELVQGYRRLCAYCALLDETGDAQWATIPALVLTGATDIGGLYRRMVDENVIRKDLSFAEMARAAQTYAMDPETGANDLSDAVAALFQSAPYSKRSYICSFAYLLDQIAQEISNGRDVHGFRFRGRRFDCGSKIGFLKATVAIALERNDLGAEFGHFLENLAELTASDYHVANAS